MREASVVAGVYGAQLPDIDDPRAEAVRRTTNGTERRSGWAQN
jgi:hypothetical protein